MPVYQITAPNGKTYRISGPEGASDEQIRMEVLKQHPEAGGAPKRRERPGPKSDSIGKQLWDSVVNTAAGVAQGVASVTVDPVMDAADAVEKGLNTGLGYAGDAVLSGLGFERAGERWRQTTRDMNRGVDQRKNVSQAIEAVAPTPEWGGTERTVAQFGGAMLVPFGKLAGPRLVRAPKVPNTASQRVVAEGAKRGVPVYTTDVKPPRTFIGKQAQALGERIPVFGMGGKRAAQQEARKEAVVNLLREFGGDDALNLFDDGVNAIDDIARSLGETRAANLTKFTAAKKSVIAKHSGSGAVPINNTLKAIDEQIAKLAARKTDTAAAAITELQRLRQQVASGKSLFELEAWRADELAQVFNNDALPFAVRDVGTKAIRAIYDPLRKDMGAFIKAVGGRADYAKWVKANAYLSTMADDMSVAAVKRAINTTTVTPENVGKLLFSRNKSDVQKLYANLDAKGRQRVQAAILERAFKGSITANEGLSVERFINNLTNPKSGLATQLGVAFHGADRQAVEGAVRLLDATRRATQAGVMPPTGVQNNVAITAGALVHFLGAKGAAAAAGAAGLLARAYESATIRNMLIGLSKTQPGSKAEIAAFNRMAPPLIELLSKEIKSPAANMNTSVGVRAAAEEPRMIMDGTAYTDEDLNLNQ